MLTMCECSSSFFLLEQSLNHHVLFSINRVKSILTCCHETPTQVINLPLQPAWVTLTEPVIRERSLRVVTGPTQMEICLQNYYHLNNKMILLHTEQNC